MCRFLICVAAFTKMCGDLYAHYQDTKISFYIYMYGESVLAIQVAQQAKLI